MISWRKFFAFQVPSTSANRTENSFRLRLLCKDLRKINLVVTKNVEQPSHKSFMESLRQLAFPISFKRQLFAFDYKGSYSADGWNVYDAKSEFRRQGVPNDMWKISRVNEKYELSDTYPSVVAVPFAASDDLLKDVAAFRSRGRIPVLSWIHPVSHATITRSSQPQVGHRICVLERASLCFVSFF
jgi:myotubularin-related protein 1/2